MSKPKKRWKPTFRMMRYRKHDPAHNMLVATQRYIHANGGSVTIIGGVEVQQFGEGPNHFRIAVRCLGTPPEKKNRYGEN